MEKGRSGIASHSFSVASFEEMVMFADSAEADGKKGRVSLSLFLLSIS